MYLKEVETTQWKWWNTQLEEHVGHPWQKDKTNKKKRVANQTYNEGSSQCNQTRFKTRSI